MHTQRGGGCFCRLMTSLRCSPPQVRAFLDPTHLAVQSWLNMVTFDLWKSTVTKHQGQPKGLARATLHNVASDLDLSCDPLFGALALGLSPVVTANDAEKLAREVNLTIPEGERMTRSICGTDLAGLPRRLALTVALLKTAPKSIWTSNRDGEDFPQELLFVARVRRILLQAKDKDGPGEFVWFVNVRGGRNAPKQYSEIRVLLDTNDEGALKLGWTSDDIVGKIDSNCKKKKKKKKSTLR
eukprot:TRINITY_DN6974_c0_g1_i2.p1 TRINITY_DN6974_c0_g1~~TRINITY_DN6974_c0_g1_i2.p1  ORF type:complete len:241 (+),score=66.87 TRINITY_DN6974_c0_g1_i2:195-917(+)